MTNFKSNLIVLAAALSALALVSACSKDDSKTGVPPGQYAYIAQFPQECQAPVNTGNPTYNRGDNDDDDRDYDHDHDRDRDRNRNRHRNHRTYHPDQDDQQPTYQPVQGQPVYPQPAYPQPAYPQPTYQPVYPQQGYPQQGDPQQPVYQQSSVEYAGVHYSFSISFYKHSGCVPYNWGRAGRFHHGGCPRGTFAACAPGAGLICMPGDTYNTNEIAWYNYRQGSPTAGLCGYESRQTAGACSYRSRDDGSGNIGRACVMSQPQTCGTGRCAPINDGSQVGVCVR